MPVRRRGLFFETRVRDGIDGRGYSALWVHMVRYLTLIGKNTTVFACEYLVIRGDS